MKKLFWISSLIALSACGPDCPSVIPQDPDDVTGAYEVKYKLYFDGATEAAVEGDADVYLGPGISSTGERIELVVSFSPRGATSGESEMVDWLQSGLVELKGAPGNYSVIGQSGEGTLSLYKAGLYNLIYYDAEVSVSGKVVGKAGAATRCSYVPQTPGMYHDIELVIEASVNRAAGGAESDVHRVRLEIFK